MTVSGESGTEGERRPETSPPAPSPIMLASSVTSHEIGCIVIGVARCCMGEVKFPFLLWLMKREKLPIICTTGASVTLRERSGSVHLCAHCTQTRMPVSSKFQPAIGALVTDLLPWGTKMGNGAGLNPLHDSTPNAFVLYLAVCIRLHLQWPAQTRIPFLLPTLGQKDSKNRCDAYASLPCKWLSGGHSATVAFALSFYNRLYEGAHRRGVIILVISRSDHKSCPALLLW